MRINQYVAKQLGLPEDKVVHNIQRYGNTTAATIPILLAEAERERDAEARDEGRDGRLRLRLHLGRRRSSTGEREPSSHCVLSVSAKAEDCPWSSGRCVAAMVVHDGHHLGEGRVVRGVKDSLVALRVGR